ncbi:MAG TPA: hypothetical protein VEU33_05915 [Archangium sp.]|nr:hypothetical protein [Archangium sp.]
MQTENSDTANVHQLPPRPEWVTRAHRAVDRAALIAEDLHAVTRVFSFGAGVVIGFGTATVAAVASSAARLARSAALHIRWGR